jgi:hypothetical protein
MFYDSLPQFSTTSQPPQFGIDKLSLVPQSGEGKISKVNERIKWQSL